MQIFPARVSELDISYRFKSKNFPTSTDQFWGITTLSLLGSSAFDLPRQIIAIERNNNFFMFLFKSFNWVFVSYIQVFRRLQNPCHLAHIFLG